MLVIEFSLPAIRSGTKGKAASARIMHTAGPNFAVSCFAQWTVDELSLMSPTCAPADRWHTTSITNQRRSKSAASRSEFKLEPYFFPRLINASLINEGHSIQNTVGMHSHSFSSPTITPPTLWEEESTIPTYHGRPFMSCLQGVGDFDDSLMMVRISRTACNRVCCGAGKQTEVFNGESSPLPVGNTIKAWHKFCRTDHPALI